MRKVLMAISLVFVLNTELSVVQFDGYVSKATILECIQTDISEGCFQTGGIILENILSHEIGIWRY